ncbi:CoA transferase [Spongiibacter taiwanensis]|uniref:CaiB/BaiF CoA transferase family protein n=1 Tax=Spongiibacter taiwanensis TaxID=1748242 RepID=UPI0020358AAD|nr:CaiB/BaiF CoA-transferase family protein [Spongiibacter taiwanensis]USA43822.1 CoA transferase [Spongiibacter taiwanensis]
MGPLHGFRIIEFEGLGPAPFAGMMFADMGAEVISITRKTVSEGKPFDNAISERGKKSIAVNLKSPEGIALILQLIESADALIEGFRPGVMERLGLGPEVCQARNPKLVYGRMTGWGQTGPKAHLAGHDINYIALSGALHASGRAGEKPTPAINLVGDFGGGGMYLAFGVVSAMLEASRSGQGQVVDVSMVEGAASLMNMVYSFFNNANFGWKDERGVNILDTGAHFYDTYETRDGKYMAIGPIEPQFYQLLKEKMGLSEDLFGDQNNQEKWPELKDRLAEIFKTRSRDEWCELLEDCDACVAPVLSMTEAPHHPHNLARQSFVEVGGHLQPGPAPKFSRSVPPVPTPASRPGSDTDRVLSELLGCSEQQVQSYRASGVLT